jgi:hypothetical protein
MLLSLLQQVAESGEAIAEALADAVEEAASKMEEAEDIMGSSSSSDGNAPPDFDASRFMPGYFDRTNVDFELFMTFLTRNMLAIFLIYPLLCQLRPSRLLPKAWLRHHGPPQTIGSGANKQVYTPLCVSDTGRDLDEQVLPIVTSLVTICLGSYAWWGTQTVWAYHVCLLAISQDMLDSVVLIYEGRLPNRMYFYVLGNITFVLGTSLLGVPIDNIMNPVIMAMAVHHIVRDIGNLFVGLQESMIFNYIRIAVLLVSRGFVTFKLGQVVYFLHLYFRRRYLVGIGGLIAFVWLGLHILLVVNLIKQFRAISHSSTVLLKATARNRKNKKDDNGDDDNDNDSIQAQKLATLHNSHRELVVGLARLSTLDPIVNGIERLCCTDRQRRLLAKKVRSNRR